MKTYRNIQGVPDFIEKIFGEKASNYVVLIPIINEGDRIISELRRAKKHKISKLVDIVLCDGGSVDGCTDEGKIKNLDVNTLLIKEGTGRQGAQLRMGIWWALDRGYEGIITIDGNNKDSIEDIPKFISKLQEGYDFVQGSRFLRGGKAVRTPLSRLFAVKFLHAPIISLTAHKRFTDTTNAYRAYSSRYLLDSRVKPLRDCFNTYELLAYLSVRASQIGLNTCEVPVKRIYPRKGKLPTKISFFKGNMELIKILLMNALGKYNPREDSR
ncbi:glycosyltransferase family 2 protein [Oribacterium sinus]|uniref:glycosyltransferase family 2 protein n=1 Tax=Oribacterium sinus TaxID=237576 RepID=UPI0028D8B68D|nr:glycosyltransferase family 2 protein [Oribacterium sinus]